MKNLVCWLSQCQLSIMMGIFYCKRPETYPEPVLSYELLCSSLSKWYGEPAFFAHVIYLDSLETSYISEVIKWKVCARRSNRYEYVEFVLKFYPRNKCRGRSFRSDEFFKNEIVFYENVLPELLNFQKSKNIPEIYDNHLKVCFSISTGKDNAICFGDALVDNFENCKLSRIDEEHGKLILKTLAKFHAISFALKDQNPEKFELLRKQITETYFSEKYWGWYKKLWNNICLVAKDAVEKEYSGTKYVQKINEFAVQNRYKEMLKAVKDKNNGVILHGDCDRSNYLFKYDQGRPVDVKMVDFQQTRCASAVLDVSSIFYNNAELLKNYDELLKYYHEELSSQIVHLGSKPEIYSWSTFIKEVRMYSFFGLACSFEAATTRLTAEDIHSDRIIATWDQSKTLNIADVIDVKNLEDHPRLDLANSFVHCVDYGYLYIYKRGCPD